MGFLDHARGELGLGEGPELEVAVRGSRVRYMTAGLR